jgi:amino acid adenylation domain-containing protein
VKELQESVQNQASVPGLPAGANRCEGSGPVPLIARYISRRVSECRNKTHPEREVCFVPFRMEDIEQSIPSRFEAQVLRFPDRIAVKTHDTVLTYKSLNDSANRIARAIMARAGSGQEPVAYLLADDAKSIATFLGILKSGNIYVPLDPEHPRSRSARVLEDAQAVLIVTDSENLAAAEELSVGVEPLNIDTIPADVSSENTGLLLAPDSLAYIIYTSGSTGEPKGVLQSHRTRLFNTMNTTNSLRLTPADRVSLFSARTSAQAMTIIFSALLNGAAICPFRTREVGLDCLSAWLIQEEITIYHSISSIFNSFVRTLKGSEQFPRLRVVKLGGEPVSRREFELYKRHFSPGCIFMNSLSSTEAGTFREYIADHQTEFTGNVIPAGYPVPEQEVLLLDETGNSVGLGEIGEIAVRSRYLSPGYWRRPDLTQAAFLPDPGGSNMRIYRTGDLGRLSGDGCLQHLGRKDFQVKICGNRIELAEIEMSLLEIATVAQAVVVAAKDKRGDPCLVAYVVSSAKPVPTAASLRRVLRKTLPEYMVPSAFVMLNTLPMTPQGKVDRQALPTAKLEVSYVPPRNPVEAQLAKMWGQILGVSPVGIQDDFFELGGNSLLAVQLMNWIESVFGKRLPISTLFSASTIQDLAELIPQPASNKSLSPLIEIQGHGSRTPFFFLHGLYNGGGFYCLWLAHQLGDDQPFYALQPLGPQGESLPETIEIMANSYLELLRTVQPQGPYLLGGFCNGGLIAFEMARQLRARGETVELLVVIDAFAKNTDLRIHRRLVGLAARILRLGPGEELDCFLHVRSFLTEFRSLSGMERAEFVFKKTRKIWLKVATKLLSWIPRPNFSRRPVATIQAAAGTADDPVWKDRGPHYWRIINGYVAFPYQGRVTLLRTNGHESSADDPTLGWSDVTPDVEVYMIPGDHGTCVFDPENIAVVGERLKSCLDRQCAATDSQTRRLRECAAKG